MLVAASQGTATATRYLVELAEAKEQMPKMLICEGYAASFNACFEHASDFLCPLSAYVPFKYYILPYIMKFVSWSYNPTQTSLALLEKLPQDFPIILVHCPQDRLTPYAGALAAYQKLRKTGHNNIYLISVDVDLKTKDPQGKNHDIGHLDVLDDNQGEKSNLKKLYSSIINDENSHINDENSQFRQQYQPDIGHCGELLRYESREKWTTIMWHINTKIVLPAFILFCLNKFSKYIM